MSDITSTWTDDFLRLQIDAELRKSNSNDDPVYWFRVIRDHPTEQPDWGYWAHRIEIGDGVGKGYPGAPVPPAPAPAPSPSPQPAPIDLSALLAKGDEILAAIKGASDANTAKLDELKGDVIHAAKNLTTVLPLILGSLKR